MGFFPSSSNRILAGPGWLLNANILTAVPRYGTITFIAADGASLVHGEFATHTPWYSWCFNGSADCGRQYVNGNNY